MGMLELHSGENVLFPTPYEEDKVVPLILTNLRVVQFTGDKRQEVDARKISFLGRSSRRPLIFFAIFFILTGLPVVGYGAYLYLSVRGMPSFSEQPPAEENPEFEDPGTVRIKAAAFAVAGAIWVALGLLCAKRQKHVVLCRADRRLMKIPVKDKQEQTQVLMTLQACVSGAKAMDEAMAKARAVEEAAKKANPPPKQKTLAIDTGPPKKR